MFVVPNWLSTAGQEIAREELFFGIWLFLLGHAASGAAGSGGAAVEEPIGVTNQQRDAGGDEDDDQKMLSPQRH